MFCPNASIKELAYMYWKLPEVADKYEKMILDYEDKFKRPWKNDFWPILKERIFKKYIPMLEDETKYNQATIFDYIGDEDV